jgi:hypothetical protein
MSIWRRSKGEKSAGAREVFPHNALEVGLAAVRAGDEPLEAWLHALQQSTVFALLHGTSLQVLVIDGLSLATVFTSEQMMREVSAEQLYIAPAYAELVDLLPDGVGLLVNPGSDVSVTIPAAELRPRTGDGPRTVGASRLFIGEPAVEPVEVLNALSRTAHGIGEVREMRRAWVSVDGAEPGLMIGVDLDPDNDAARAAVMNALRDGLPSEVVTDLLFANDRSPIIDWMWSNTEPFHVKS